MYQTTGRHITRTDAVAALKRAAVLMLQSLAKSERFDEDATTDELELSVGAIYGVVNVAHAIQYGGAEEWVTDSADRWKRAGKLHEAHGDTGDDAETVVEEEPVDLGLTF